MQLLVSVQNAAEAGAALAGGADVIDAKDPASGALGAVSPHVLREICERVGDTRPVTAALGDDATTYVRDGSEAALEDMTRAFVEAGAVLVKIGFAGASAPARVSALLQAAIRGTRAGATTGIAPRERGVVAVAYADAETMMIREELLDAAAAAGATGVLLDTANKSGPGLRGIVSPSALTAWIAAAHDRGLLAAVAGKLTADDLPVVRDAGADIAGVRGAACIGGRSGIVHAERVRLLRRACRSEKAPAGHRRIRL